MGEVVGAMYYDGVAVFPKVGGNEPVRVGVAKLRSLEVAATKVMRTKCLLSEVAADPDPKVFLKEMYLLASMDSMGTQRFP